MPTISTPVKYEPIARQRPTDDLIRAFLQDIIDWDTETIKTNATFTGTINVNLDATTDNVEVKGKDSGSTPRTLRTDNEGRLITLNRGLTDVEVQHFTNSSAPIAGVTETLTNAVSGLIVNGNVEEIGVSFDGGSTFFPLKKNAFFQWDGTNSSVIIKSLGTGAAEFHGTYSARV